MSLTYKVNNQIRTIETKDFTTQPPLLMGVFFRKGDRRQNMAQNVEKYKDLMMEVFFSKTPVEGRVLRELLNGDWTI